MPDNSLFATRPKKTIILGDDADRVADQLLSRYNSNQVRRILERLGVAP